MTYVNGILTKILRDALEADVYTIQQDVTDGTATRLPFVVAAQIPGGSGRIDPRFRGERALVQVDGYDEGSRAAQALCQDALDALVAAWRQHTQTPDGRVAGVGDISGPYPLSVQASGTYRYSATANLTVR